MVSVDETVGVLMVNTGSPEEPTPRSVRKYLSRFLSDPRICPMNPLAWRLILHLCILPVRGKKSARKYRAIWTREGSPLSIAHDKLNRGLQRAYDEQGAAVEVRTAMSYSAPSISDQLEELRSCGCTRLVVLPLYPQSAHSTTGAVKDGLARALRKLPWDVECDVVEQYSEDAVYAKAIAASIRNAGFGEQPGDRLLFAFHSIPLADIERGDTYELQTGATSLAVACELGLDRTNWTIGYQCRFDKGREWLGPFTKDVLARWAANGRGRVFMVCPNFAVDCLETLYDIGCELQPYYEDQVRKNGRDYDAQPLVAVPCLNATKAHVSVLQHVLAPYVGAGSGA